MREPAVLVELLLEMDVLNPRDLERRVDLLAADIDEPVFAKWFTQASNYWLKNMDELTQRSYAPERAPWRVKYVGTRQPFLSQPMDRINPEGKSAQLLATLTPHKNDRAQKGTGVWWGTKEPDLQKTVSLHFPMTGSPQEQEAKANKLKALGLREPIPIADWERWDDPEWRSEKQKILDKVKGLTDPLSVEDWDRVNSPAYVRQKQAERTQFREPGYFEKAAKLRKLNAQAGPAAGKPAAGKKQSNPFARKRAKRAVAEALLEADPKELLLAPEYKALKTAVTTGADAERLTPILGSFLELIGSDPSEIETALQDYQPAEALINLTKNANLPPEARQVMRGAAKKLASFSTKLHQPHWKKQIDQEFIPYSTENPPDEDQPYSPPKDVPDWATAQNKKDLLFFDPVRAHTRELWQKLEAVVDYFNYFDYARKNYAESKIVDERNDAVKGDQLYARLEKAEIANPDIFMDILGEASNFRDNEFAYLRRYDAKVLARHNDLQLLELTSVEAVEQFSSMPTKYHPSGHTTWCTRKENGGIHVNGYFTGAGGVMHFIAKDSQPYVLMAKPVQCKNVSNSPLSSHPNMVREIAPLLAASGKPPEYWRYSDCDLTPAVQAEMQRSGK